MPLLLLTRPIGLRDLEVPRNLPLPRSENHQLLDSIRDTLNDHSTSEDSLALAIIFAAVIIAVAIVGTFLRRREARAHVEPTVDYLTLAVDTIGLAEDERHDLEKLAAAAKLEQPASLLLSPANLAHAVEAAIGPRAEHNATYIAANRICEKVFGAALPRVTSHEMSQERSRGDDAAKR